MTVWLKMLTSSAKQSLSTKLPGILLTNNNVLNETPKQSGSIMMPQLPICGHDPGVNIHIQLLSRYHNSKIVQVQ
jgi:hypothetical protein